jgi:uncharacterized protein (TIGR04255 family)
MSRKYKNPPIIEALCELQFVPNQPWDLTLPGLMYEEVKDRFPIKQQQVGIGVQFRSTEKGLEHRVEPAPPRVQFYRGDKAALIQVAPDLFVINQLKPYPTWSVFKPLISENFQIYKRVANPRGFKRIGLRYINKIIFNVGPVKLEDYFNFYPAIPEELPQVHADFISRAEILYSNNRDRMIITISNAIPEVPNAIPIILDLDYIMIIQEGIPMESFEEWLEQAHTAVEIAFESCITDRCRAIFEDEVQ